MEVLPEDEIQNLLVGFNCIMDYALTLKLQVIKLKQHTVRVFNSAVTGTVCRKLLDILVYTYGYPKSYESWQQGLSLATFAYPPSSKVGPEEDKLLDANEAQQSAEFAQSISIGQSIASGITEK